MAGKFPRNQVAELLAHCHRRCCICHRFCGVKIETDHISQPKEGGTDEIENAIPVCFECHAEIHSYNPQHPRGRKYTAEELREHKAQWLEICRTRPETFVNAHRNADVGPLQALIDELEFNLAASRQQTGNEPGCPFQDAQFLRATREGAISVLDERLKQSIIEAYIQMGLANQSITSVLNTPRGTNLWHPGAAQKLSAEAGPYINDAKERLLMFLSGDQMNDAGQ